jgi:hypothetical protein
MKIIYNDQLLKYIPVDARLNDKLLQRLMSIPWLICKYLKSIKNESLKCGDFLILHIVTGYIYFTFSATMVTSS